MVNNTNHDSRHYVTDYIDDIRLAEIMITLVTINKTDGIRKYVTTYIDNISNISIKKGFYFRLALVDIQQNVPLFSVRIFVFILIDN